MDKIIPKKITIPTRGSTTIPMIEKIKYAINAIKNKVISPVIIHSPL
jgi:hypothetical protein